MSDYGRVVAEYPKPIKRRRYIVQYWRYGWKNEDGAGYRTRFMAKMNAMMWPGVGCKSRVIDTYDEEEDW